MNATKDETIRVIVVDDSSNDAETVANMLRNAGYTTRAVRAEGDDDLRAALARQHWDMVLSKLSIPFFSAFDVLAVLEKARADVPLLLIADGADSAKVTEVLRAGARDAVYMAQPARLEHAVLREVSSVRQRRRHRQCEALLGEANERAQALVESSRDAIALVSEGMHIFANEPYVTMFGYSDLIELEGLPVMDLVADEDQVTFKEFLRRYMKGAGGNDSIDVTALRADGKPFPLTMEFSTAAYEGERCVQIIIRDQSLSQELERRLDDLAKQDLLTGVYNRQYFLESLDSLVGKPGKTGAVLYIRPDDFREVRERLGVAASDGVLSELATVLERQIDADGDFVARFETHVFTAVLQGADETTAEAMGRRMLEAAAGHIIDVAGQSISATCSIGITLYSEAIAEPQEIITRAERAYRQAAERGHGSLILFNPAAADMAERERRSLWEQRIRKALQAGEFRLLYQPLVSLEGDDTENYEVLVRMIGKDGADIAPDSFIPAAEETGLMAGVDRWVLVHALKRTAERRNSGKQTNIFVKLSSSSVRDPKLLPWLRDLLSAARIEPASLTLEVSEAVAGSNIKALKMLAEGTRRLGVRLALDHAGLAPNFSNMLKHCEAAVVKIDGSLIARMSRDPAARETVEQITATAKESGKLVIAEFVEDAHTLATIWSSGVDLIQGNFVQPPSAAMDYDFSPAG